MKPLTLQRMAMRLGHLSQLMSVQAETADEADRFYKALDQVLALPPEKESVVLGMTVSGLHDIGDADSAQWLLAEAEIESTLQYMPSGAGRDKACLLFAMPVIIGRDDSVACFADEPQLLDLHAHLSDCEVIDTSANFGIVTRLFTYMDLFSKSFGQLKDLNKYLAAQVMQGDKCLHLPEDFETGPLDGASCSPFVDLYFIVGIAVTYESDLDNVFPPLASDEESAAGGAFEKESGYMMTDKGETITYNQAGNGLTEEGEIWETGFCESFNGTFGAIEGSFTVLPPDGIIEDLRRGLTLAREVGLLQMFEIASPDETSPVFARLSPVQEVDNESWVVVSCLSAVQGSPLGEARWPVMNHETDAEAYEILIDCLKHEKIALEEPLADSNNPLGSLLLH